MSTDLDSEIRRAINAWVLDGDRAEFRALVASMPGWKQDLLAEWLRQAAAIVSEVHE